MCLVTVRECAILILKPVSRLCVLCIYVFYPFICLSRPQQTRPAQTKKPRWVQNLGFPRNLCQDSGREVKFPSCIRISCFIVWSLMDTAVVSADHIICLSSPSPLHQSRVFHFPHFSLVPNISKNAWYQQPALEWRKNLLNSSLAVPTALLYSLWKALSAFTLLGYLPPKWR